MTKNYSNRSCGEETESRNVYKTPVIVHYCVVVSVPEEDMDIFDFSKFGDIKPSSRAHFNAGHPFYVETLTNSSLTVDFLCLHREGSVERSRTFLYVVKCRFQRYFIVQRHTTLTLPIRLWHDLVKKNRKTDNQLLLPWTEIKIEEKEKNKVSTSTADDWLQIICIDSIRHSFGLCLLTIVKRYIIIVSRSLPLTAFQSWT